MSKYDAAPKFLTGLVREIKELGDLQNRRRIRLRNPDELVQGAKREGITGEEYKTQMQSAFDRDKAKLDSMNNLKRAEHKWENYWTKQPLRREKTEALKELKYLRNEVDARAPVTPADNERIKQEINEIDAHFENITTQLRLMGDKTGANPQATHLQRVQEELIAQKAGLYEQLKGKLPESPKPTNRAAVAQVLPKPTQYKASPEARAAAQPKGGATTDKTQIIRETSTQKQDRKIQEEHNLAAQRRNKLAATAGIGLTAAGITDEAEANKILNTALKSLEELKELRSKYHLTERGDLKNTFEALRLQKAIDGRTREIMNLKRRIHQMRKDAPKNVQYNKQKLAAMSPAGLGFELNLDESPRDETENQGRASQYQAYQPPPYTHEEFQPVGNIPRAAWEGVKKIPGQIAGLGDMLGEVHRESVATHHPEKTQPAQASQTMQQIADRIAQVNPNYVPQTTGEKFAHEAGQWADVLTPAAALTLYKAGKISQKVYEKALQNVPKMMPKAKPFDESRRTFNKGAAGVGAAAGLGGIGTLAMMRKGAGKAAKPKPPKDMWDEDLYDDASEAAYIRWAEDGFEWGVDLDRMTDNAYRGMFNKKYGINLDTPIIHPQKVERLSQNWEMIGESGNIIRGNWR